MRGSSRVITFATSNAHKVKEARVVLAEFGLRVRQVQGKGEEIQADTLRPISEWAAREASRAYGRPLIVEDSGLFVDGLGGFPGPYSSYVYKKVGLAGFLGMFGEIEPRSATFMSCVSYCAPGGEPVSFEGESAGKIATAPSGRRGFGFDPVFVPRGFRETFSEMVAVQKSRVSHRGEALRKFARWFLEERVASDTVLNSRTSGLPKV